MNAVMLASCAATLDAVVPATAVCDSPLAVVL
jgi:hypothetical protein